VIELDYRSITIAGAVMAISTFIIIVLFFTISSPMEHMFNAFDDVDAGEATDEINEYLPNIETAFWMGMAIAIITPAVIFIFWVFKREPDWFYERRFR